MKPSVTWVGCVIACGIAACSSPANEQLLSQCSGQFACHVNGDPMARTGLVLTAQGDECSTGAYLLHPDGTVTAASAPPESGTWNASAWGDNYKEFDFTAGTDSYSCHSAQLVTCVRTFQVTSDCDYNAGMSDTECVENVAPANCSSSSWTDDGAYCTTENDDIETAFTNGESCADLGY